MKKILSLVLAILLLVSATSLVGCGGDSNSNGSTNKPAEKDAQAEALVSEIGGASETFVGTLSEEKYASAEEAAQAYVAEEVVGEKEAEILIAEGEAQYMKILSEAYADESKTEFYSFVRSLDALKISMSGNNKTVILSPDSPIAQIFYNN